MNPTREQLDRWRKLSSVEISDMDDSDIAHDCQFALFQMLDVYDSQAAEIRRYEKMWELAIFGGYITQPQLEAIYELASVPSDQGKGEG